MLPLCLSKMVNINITVDASQVENMLVKVKQNIPMAGNQMTRKSAFALKRKIKANIPHRTSSRHEGHSTPVPLGRYLHLQKSTVGHDVFFSGDEISKGTLSKAVEFGTSPHTIESPRGSGNIINHPGARATNFFSRSVNDFISTELDGVVKEGAEMLVRGLGR